MVAPIIIVADDVIITALKAVGQSLKGIRRIMDDISILEKFPASRVEG